MVLVTSVTSSSWMLVIMESLYVMTGKQVYQDMVKFWGKLFGINFGLCNLFSVNFRGVGHDAGVTG